MPIGANPCQEGILRYRKNEPMRDDQLDRFNETLERLTEAHRPIPGKAQEVLGRLVRVSHLVYNDEIIMMVW